jgi:hypothetical protein
VRTGAVLPSLLGLFDYVLLGDVHLHQLIPLKTHPVVMAYAGSLRQLNFGESLDQHGVLVWDITVPGTPPELVEIANGHLRHTIDADCWQSLGDAEAVVAGLQGLHQAGYWVNQRMRISYSLDVQADWARAAFADVEFRQWVLHRVGKPRSLSAKGATTDHLRDIACGNVLELMQKLHPESSGLIQEAHEYISGEACEDFDSDDREFTLQVLEFENMMCFVGSRRYDFSNHVNSLVGLTGANGSGKSALIDILLFT